MPSVALFDFGLADAFGVAYEPVTNRLAKLTTY